MEDEQLNQDSSLSRWIGIGLGIGTHAAFIVTVWFLFHFLHRGVQAGDSRWLLVDGVLALQFAVVHSVLLHPKTKRRLTKWIKSEWYGLFFCLATCAGLGLMFVFWRGSPRAVWELHGVGQQTVSACFYASWVLLFYSLWLSGLGYQTGFTPWWYWLRRRPQPRRQFPTHSLYRFLRHPIYLSFLGLIWFTPRMSLDHALLTAVWTAYIFLGSYLKDERVAYYAGNAYREYQARVPGYPLFVGALGLRKRVDEEPESLSHPALTSQPLRRAA